jgi:DNA-binding Lrp family transcriptional regulator
MVCAHPDKLNTYPLCLRIAPENSSELNRIIKKISEYQEINVVMRVSGDCELLALAICKNRESALKLLDEINSIKGIVRLRDTSRLRQSSSVE